METSAETIMPSPRSTEILCAICGGAAPSVKFRGRDQKPARMTLVLYSEKSKMTLTDVHFCRDCSLKIYKQLGVAKLSSVLSRLAGE
jgi:hypothetical protein